MASPPSMSPANNVDICVTCLSDKPPKLPLREELPSLGIEVVYNARGVGVKASKHESKKAVREFQQEQEEMKKKKKRRFFPVRKKKLKAEEEDRQRIESDLRIPRAMSYERYERILNHESDTSDSSETSWESIETEESQSSNDEDALELTQMDLDAATSLNLGAGSFQLADTSGQPTAAPQTSAFMVEHQLPSQLLPSSSPAINRFSQNLEEVMRLGTKNLEQIAMTQALAAFAPTPMAEQEPGLASSSDPSTLSTKSKFPETPNIQFTASPTIQRYHLPNLASLPETDPVVAEAFSRFDADNSIYRFGSGSLGGIPGEERLSAADEKGGGPPVNAKPTAGKPQTAVPSLAVVPNDHKLQPDMSSLTMNITTDPTWGVSSQPNFQDPPEQSAPTQEPKANHGNYTSDQIYDKTSLLNTDGSMDGSRTTDAEESLEEKTSTAIAEMGLDNDDWMATAQQALSHLTDDFHGMSMTEDDDRHPFSDVPARNLFEMLRQDHVIPSVVETLLKNQPELLKSRQDGRLPLHVACDRGFPDRFSAPSDALTDELARDIASLKQLIGVVARPHIDACLVPDEKGDLPVHLLARQLMEWEAQWYECVYKRAQADSAGDGKHAAAITELYQTMSECVDMLLRPIKATKSLCKARGSVGRILPLHIAAIFTASYDIVQSLLREYPEGASAPCDLGMIRTSFPSNLLPIELHDRLSTDFPKWEISKNDSEDYLRRSDLLLAYNPNVIPFRKESERIHRIELRIRQEAMQAIDDSGGAPNRAVELLWIWLCTYINPADTSDSYVASVKRIAGALPLSCLKYLCQLKTPSGVLVLEAATPDCKKLFNSKLHAIPEPSPVVSCLDTKSSDWSLNKKSALQSLESMPSLEQGTDLRSSNSLDRNSTLKSTREAYSFKLMESISEIQSGSYDESSLEEEEEESPQPSLTVIDGRQLPGGVCKAVFSLSEDSIPTSFILLPYKLSKDEQGKMVLDSASSTGAALKFADILLELTSPGNVLHILDKKSVERFGQRLRPGETDDEWLATEKRVTELEKELFKLYSSSGRAYFYLIDELTGVPVIPMAGGVYPLEIGSPEEMVSKLLPLMLSGMILMRGAKAWSILGQIILSSDTANIPPRWVDAASDFLDFLDRKEQEENDDFSGMREEMMDFADHAASRVNFERRHAAGGNEWVIELSLLRILLDMYDSKHSFAGLRARRGGDGKVVWTTNSAMESFDQDRDAGASDVESQDESFPESEQESSINRVRISEGGIALVDDINQAIVERRSEDHLDSHSTKSTPAPGRWGTDAVASESLIDSIDSPYFSELIVMGTYSSEASSERPVKFLYETSKGSTSTRASVACESSRKSESNTFTKYGLVKSLDSELKDDLPEDCSSVEASEQLSHNDGSHIPKGAPKRKREPLTESQLARIENYSSVPTASEESKPAEEVIKSDIPELAKMSSSETSGEASSDEGDCSHAIQPHGSGSDDGGGVYLDHLLPALKKSVSFGLSKVPSQIDAGLLPEDGESNHGGTLIQRQGSDYEHVPKYSFLFNDIDVSPTTSEAGSFRAPVLSFSMPSIERKERRGWENRNYEEVKLLMSMDESLALDDVLHLKIQLDEEEAKQDIMREQIEKLRGETKQLRIVKTPIELFNRFADIEKCPPPFDARAELGCAPRGVGDVRKLLVRICALEEQALCQEVGVQQLDMEVQEFALEVNDSSPSFVGMLGLGSQDSFEPMESLGVLGIEPASDDEEPMISMGALAVESESNDESSVSDYYAESSISDDDDDGLISDDDADDDSDNESVVSGGGHLLLDWKDNR